MKAWPSLVSCKLCLFGLLTNKLIWFDLKIYMYIATRSPEQIKTRGYTASIAMQLPCSIIILLRAENRTVQQRLPPACSWLFKTVRMGEHKHQWLIIIIIVIILTAFLVHIRRIMWSVYWIEQCFMSPPAQYHRLCGSASPVLTATHHSYESLAWLSDFFPPQP